MSYQEIAKNMIDQLPEDKLIFIINILSNIGKLSGVDVYPNFTPNQEALEAFAELENGGGHRFSGTTEAFFAELMEE